MYSWRHANPYLYIMANCIEKVEIIYYVAHSLPATNFYSKNIFIPANHKIVCWFFSFVELYDLYWNAIQMKIWLWSENFHTQMMLVCLYLIYMLKFLYMYIYYSKFRYLSYYVSPRNQEYILYCKPTQSVWKVM